MIVLKILGIVSIVLLVLLAIVLLLPVNFLIVTNKQGKIKSKGRILFFVFGGKPSKNKESTDKIKKLLLGDRLAGGDSMKDEGVGTTIRSALSLVENVLERVKWLLSKCRVRRLVAHITVAHDDAAIAAIEYGSISTSVYSLAGIIDANMNVAPDAMDVKVFCDFNQNQPSCVLDVCISLRICWVAFAVAKLIWKNKKNNQYEK